MTIEYAGENRDFKYFYNDKFDIYEKVQKVNMNELSFPIYCKDTKESFMKYEGYVKSTHWKNFKDKLKHCEKCMLCGEKRECFHHISYKNIGCEDENDVIPLCKRCHELVHNRMSYNKQFIFLNYRDDIAKLPDSVLISLFSIGVNSKRYKQIPQIPSIQTISNRLCLDEYEVHKMVNTCLYYDLIEPFEKNKFKLKTSAISHDCEDKGLSSVLFPRIVKDYYNGDSTANTITKHSLDNGIGDKVYMLYRAIPYISTDNKIDSSYNIDEFPKALCSNRIINKEYMLRDCNREIYTPFYFD